MSRWFRLYDELLDDPKVQRLSGDDFKAWVNLLCLSSRGEGKLPSADDIAFALRLPAAKAKAIVSRLASVGLLDPVSDGYEPHGWNARQYKSDVSTDRVKRFRQRSKTAPETPPDTDTETDTPLAKANGGNCDSDKQFWDMAKTYLGKSSGGLINGWIRDHGKEELALAITTAQLERAVDPVAFIKGRFRLRVAQTTDAPLC